MANGDFSLFAGTLVRTTRHSSRAQGASPISRRRPSTQLWSLLTNGYSSLHRAGPSPGALPVESSSNLCGDMATFSAFAAHSPPDSEESGGESTESEVPSHSASRQYEILDPEDDICELGDGKQHQTRKRAAWECVKEWDPRVVEQDVIGQEILDLSNHYMQLSGTDELAGYFKNNAIRLGMWPRKSVQTRSKGITSVFLLSTSVL